MAVEEAKWTKIINDLAIMEEERLVKINKNQYSFNDILDCEIIENEKTITNIKGKNKVSLTKGIIGGALLGPVGAIVGGSAGKTKSKVIDNEYCTKLLLKVTIKDFKNPVEYIKFIEYRTHKDSTTYKNAVDDIQKSLSVLNIIINENDKS